MASTTHPYASDPDLPAAKPEEIYEGVIAVLLSDIFGDMDGEDGLTDRIIRFTDVPFELNGELVVEFELLDPETLRIASHEILRAHELGLVPDSYGRWNDRYTLPVMLVSQA